MALFPHKPYIERLPTAIFPKYMSREKPKFAVIIPLFGSDYNTLSEPFSDTEFGLHCYSAVWAAMCLLRNSDFQQYGVPIIFYVQENLSREAIKIFNKFELNLDQHMMTFSTTGWEDDYELDTAPLGWKLAPLVDDRLLRYKTLMLLDSDMHLAVPYKVFNLCNLYERMQGLDFDSIAFWTANPPAAVSKKSGEAMLCAGLGYTELQEHHKRDNYKMMHLNSSLTLYKHTSQKLFDFIKKWHKRSGQDEHMFKVFYMENPDEPLPLALENRLGIQQYFDQGAVAGHYERDCNHSFFSHVHVGADEDDRTDEYLDQLLIDLQRNF